MTNIRLRIEDVIPTVGFGSVGSGSVGRTPAGTRSLTTPVAYRMGSVSSANAETI
jgi:hypothetical protein